MLVVWHPRIRLPLKVLRIFLPELLKLLLLLLFTLLENIFLNILIISKIYLLLLFKSAWKKSSTLINFNQLIKIIIF